MKKLFPKNQTIEAVSEACKSGDRKRLLSCQFVPDLGTKRTMKKISDFYKYGFNRSIVEAVEQEYNLLFDRGAKRTRARGKAKPRKTYIDEAKHKQSLYMRAGTFEKLFAILKLRKAIQPKDAERPESLSSTIKACLAHLWARARKQGAIHWAKAKAKAHKLWLREWLKLYLAELWGQDLPEIRTLPTNDLIKKWLALGA